MPSNILLGCSLALLLAACTPASPPVAAPVDGPATAPPLAAASACQVGPNGGPTPLADRGIGGTGAPPAALADKGIGGTGIEGAGTIGAEKTGVLGLITGFASICVGGQEVAYTPATPVSIDGQLATPADLRAGQVAAVQATGPASGLLAQHVLIRHEVVGPVQSVSPPGAVPGTLPATLIVAGQRVTLGPTTLGLQPQPGAWVAVSGFRGADGTVAATRIDPAPPGLPPNAVAIAGTVAANGPGLRIGGATLLPAPGSPVPLYPGQAVLVFGRWLNGAVVVEAAQPDPLAAGPYGYFTPDTGVVVFETFGSFAEGRLVLSRAIQRGPGGAIRRSLISLERQGSGALRPASLRDGGPQSRPNLLGPTTPRTPPSLEPAPTPGRSPSFGSTGPGFGDNGSSAPSRSRDRPGESSAFGGGPAGPYFGGFGGGNFRPK